MKQMNPRVTESRAEGPRGCPQPWEGRFGNAGKVQVLLPPPAWATPPQRHQLPPSDDDIPGAGTEGI